MMHDYIFNIISTSVLNQYVNSTKENYPRPELIRIETLKKLNKFIKEKNKHILILQPNWEKHRNNKTIIILDQELKFNDLESLQDAKTPTRKCSRCKIRDTEDYSIFWNEKNRKVICKICDEELRNKRNFKKLKKFQKALLKFYRSKKCKFITFEETRKYFYKTEKMSSYVFDETLVEIICNELIKTRIELFNTPSDKNNYSDKLFEWPNKPHYQYKQGDKFSLWTIEGI